MISSNLKPGDRFEVVGHVDPEGPIRVCLTNDKAQGLRFGFPDRQAFWCYMGDQVEVELEGDAR